MVDIAYKNPRTYPIITAILSKILSLEVDKNVINEILNSIENKFNKIPNVGHLQVWLQRLTLKIDEQKEYKGEEKLCKKVIDDNVQIWNISWLDSKIQQVFNNNSIIDKQKKEDMPLIIERDEINIYKY